MPWRETFETARMGRIAVVTTTTNLRETLVTLAAQGCAEPELLTSTSGSAAAALHRAQARLSMQTVAPLISLNPTDLAVLEEHDDVEAIAGEVELEKVSASTIGERSVSALVAWAPLNSLDALSSALAPHGAAVTRLSPPRGAQPPTSLRGTNASAAFQPLVNTYGTVPYSDLNPSVLAGVAYVLMFGMMFGDAGHGVLLLALGVALAWVSRNPDDPLRKYRWATPFVIGAGITSIAFGFAFGEAFGPTGLVPTLWLRPLDHTATLLAVSIAIGAVLLAFSYALGALNRLREGGVARSLVALSGFAGAALYFGLAIIGAGWYFHHATITIAGAALAAVALTLGFLGLFAESGGKASGALEASVELFDAVLRLGTNTVSFARLAAFGLTHAALCSLVWDGSASLWHRSGAVAIVGSILVFCVGNIVTFALEALVAGVQALRLEYYEIFSRVFTAEGREFHPWHVNVRQ